MKKILIAALCVVCALALAACSAPAKTAEEMFDEIEGELDNVDVLEENAPESAYVTENTDGTYTANEFETSPLGTVTESYGDITFDILPDYGKYENPEDGAVYYYFTDRPEDGYICLQRLEGVLEGTDPYEALAAVEQGESAEDGVREFSAADAAINNFEFAREVAYLLNIAEADYWVYGYNFAVGNDVYSLKQVLPSKDIEYNPHNIINDVFASAAA